MSLREDFDSYDSISPSSHLLCVSVFKFLYLSSHLLRVSVFKFPYLNSHLLCVSVFKIPIFYTGVMHEAV